jgi:eukaryotic-like serine/threonine-protein kinase
MSNLSLSQSETNSECQSTERLEQYLGGWLDDKASAELESHLAQCAECETRLSLIEERGTVDPLLEPVQVCVEKEADSVAGKKFWDIGHPWQPALPSRQLGPYELLQPLGHGGMGFVYLARHSRLDRCVAIKLLPGYCQSDFSKERFEREIAAIGRLQHPAIVAATDAGQIGDVLFLVMEYVRGFDLAKICKSKVEIGVEEVCEIARQIALGLSYAHASGMVHRDIKPSNVMLDDLGAVKILDFGLVQLDRWDGAASELTTVGQFLGTLDYMAPEQAVQSGSVDYRADLYALGATMFRLLCGRGPLAASPNQSPLEKLRILAEHSPPSLKVLRPDAPDGLVKIVDSLLATKPENRPASAAHVAESLMPLAMGAKLAMLNERSRQSIENQNPTAMESLAAIDSRSQETYADLDLDRDSMHGCDGSVGNSPCAGNIQRTARHRFGSQWRPSRIEERWCCRQKR